MDDEAFRRGIRRREPEVWTRLVALYHGPLTRQARRILTKGMDADNAVGEMWCRALAAAWRYDPRRPPYPWLARICLTTCLKQRERELRIVQGDGEPAGRRDRAAPRDERRVLRDALCALPRRQREVVALRYLFEVSVSEIAVLLGRSRKTVEKTLLRALRRLRETAQETGLQAFREGA